MTNIRECNNIYSISRNEREPMRTLRCVADVNWNSTNENSFLWEWIWLVDITIILFSRQFFKTFQLSSYGFLVGGWRVILDIIKLALLSGSTKENWILKGLIFQERKETVSCGIFQTKYGYFQSTKSLKLICKFLFDLCFYSKILFDFIILIRNSHDFFYYTYLK